MDKFEDAYPLLFRQRDLLKILVYDRWVRHRKLHNKGNIKREFDTGDIVVISTEVKSRIKYGVHQKLLLKIKGPYRVLEKVTTI